MNFTKRTPKETKIFTSIKKTRLFLLFPATQAFLLAAILIRAGSGHTNSSIVFACIMTVFCILSDFGIYRAIKESSKKGSLEQEKQFYQKQLDMQTAHYEAFSKYNASLAQTRSLLEQQAQGLETALNMGNYTRASELLADTCNHLKDLDPVTYCRHKIINALIFVKSRDMQEAGISFSHSIELNENLPIQEMDLCRVFSNILDNAIEACLVVKKSPAITLQCRIIKGYLVIHSTNTVLEKPKLWRNTLPPSSKSEPGHGQGLKIIQSVAAKYNGEMVLSSAPDGRFSITVMLVCSACTAQ
ncbi:ATP-binding protein [bacterium 210820-DFI.6.37]|nr:ATP-binding protein [bacterium 210820-DFI.6.37]